MFIAQKRSDDTPGTPLAVMLLGKRNTFQPIQYVTMATVIMT